MGMDVHRIRFERAIASAMQQKPGAPSAPEAGGEPRRDGKRVTPFGEYSGRSSLKARMLALAKRIVRRVARPLVGPVRRALVGHIEAMVVGLHAKQDAALLRQDHILGQQNHVLSNQDFILGKHDAALGLLTTALGKLDVVAQDLRQLETVTAQQADFNERLTALRARIDDIGVKVRGPIELDSQTLAVRTADGYAVVPRDDTVLTTMLIDADVGGLEPGTRSVLQRLLRPGATFVDVGAHIGLLTLVGARAVGALGRVHAFEAGPDTFALLQRTVAMNHLAPRVIARSVAVGAVAEQRTFHVRDVMGHSSLYDFALSDVGKTIQHVAVEVHPLDDLMPPGEKIDLVKIDVEGAELDVLAGMKRILATNPEIVLIVEFGPSHLARTGVTPEAWFAAFTGEGFDALAIDEETGACRPVEAIDVVDAASVNIVFVAPYSPMARILR